MSAKVVPFPQETVGTLIDWADRIAEYRVMAELRRHFAEASRLDIAGEHGSQFLRNLITAACLINRVLFEIQAVPKDRAARI